MAKYAFSSFRRPPQRHIRAAWWLCCLGSASCIHTLNFSESEPIAIIGYRPAPPPPPEPPKPEPPKPPPPTPKRVEVQQDQIVIHDKIQFETDQAIIKPESYGLLDEITLVVANNPQIKRLSIQGHTDSTGSDYHNRQLSDARAHSVLDYLVQHGIEPARLVAKGWGESKPIASNITAIGREQNRRVEFVIIEQSAIRRTYEIDPKTGQQREVAIPPIAPNPGFTP